MLSCGVRLSSGAGAEGGTGRGLGAAAQKLPSAHPRAPRCFASPWQGWTEPQGCFHKRLLACLATHPAPITVVPVSDPFYFRFPINARVSPPALLLCARLGRCPSMGGAGSLGQRGMGGQRGTSHLVGGLLFQGCMQPLSDSARLLPSRPLLPPEGVG